MHIHKVKSAIVQEGIRYNENGDLVIPVRGQPFGAPDARDLTKEFFDKDTNFGPLVRVLSYFDHQNDEKYTEKGIGLGKRPVGYAELTSTDDKGRNWDIVYQLKSIPVGHLDKNTMDADQFEKAISDRRKKYLSVIEKAARQGILEASGIAYDRVDDPNIKGRIAEWDSIGMDLTPTNADTRAHVLKSMEIEGENMPTKEELEAAEKKRLEDEAAAKAKTEADAKAAADAKAEADKKAAEAAAANAVITRINETFDKLGENKEMPVPQVAELVEMVKSLSKSVADLTALVTSELAKINGEGQDTVKGMLVKANSEILLTQQALPPLGERIARFVKGDSAVFLKQQEEADEMRRRQKSIEEQRGKNAGFPASAPGG